MSDPRDPRYTDPHRRSGAQANGDAGFWPWLTAALTALGLLIGGTIGYGVLISTGLNRARLRRLVRPHRSSSLRPTIGNIPGQLYSNVHAGPGVARSSLLEWV